MQSEKKMQIVQWSWWDCNRNAVSLWCRPREAAESASSEDRARKRKKKSLIRNLARRKKAEIDSERMMRNQCVIKWRQKVFLAEEAELLVMMGDKLIIQESHCRNP